MAKSNYSKIKSIEVRNFRNIGVAAVSFEKSPIVCLLGDNEAGKTSFNMATTVCATNVDPKSQKEYIRKGTNGFGVKINLEDGHSVLRMKTSDSNIYQVTKDGEEVYSASKLSEGIPKEVTDLMGIIMEDETRELLQVRTYEDKLLFAYTTGTTNKKMMYNALKVENLTNAIKIGNEDINGIRSEKSNNEIACGTVMGQLRGIHLVDVSIVETLLNKVKELSNQEEKLSLLDNLNKIVTSGYIKMNGIANLTAGLNELNETQIKNLVRLVDLKKQSELVVPDHKGVCELNSRLYEKVAQCRSLVSSLNVYVPDTSEVADIDLLVNRINIVSKLKSLCEELKKVEFGAFKELEQAKELKVEPSKKLQIMKELVANIKENKEQLEKMQAEIHECKEFLEHNSDGVITCPNCGELIIAEKAVV